MRKFQTKVSPIYIPPRPKENGPKENGQGPYINGVSSQKYIVKSARRHQEKATKEQHMFVNRRNSTSQRVSGALKHALKQYNAKVEEARQLWASVVSLTVEPVEKVEKKAEKKPVKKKFVKPRYRRRMSFSQTMALAFRKHSKAQAANTHSTSAPVSPLTPRSLSRRRSFPHLTARSVEQPDADKQDWDGNVPFAELPNVLKMNLPVSPRNDDKKHYSNQRSFNRFFTAVDSEMLRRTQSAKVFSSKSSNFISKYITGIDAKNIHCTNRFHPKSVFRRVSSFLVVLTVLYFTVVVPFDLGFRTKDPESISIVFAYVFDVLYVFEMLQKAFTGYVTHDQDTVYTRKLIWKRYLKGGFIADLLSVMVIPLNALPASHAKRALMLLRLLRLYSINEFFRMRYGNLGTQFGKARLLKFVLAVLITAHLTACLWFFLARIENADDSWISYYSRDSARSLLDENFFEQVRLFDFSHTYIIMHCFFYVL